LRLVDRADRPRRRRRTRMRPAMGDVQQSFIRRRVGAQTHRFAELAFAVRSDAVEHGLPGGLEIHKAPEGCSDTTMARIVDDRACQSLYQRGLAPGVLRTTLRHFSLK